MSEVGKLEKKGRVRRLVRKPVPRAGEDERRGRMAPASCSWACARVAARPKDEDDRSAYRRQSRMKPAYVPPPPPRRRTPAGLIGLSGKLVAMVWLLIQSLRPDRWRRTTLAVLAAVAAAFVGGLVLEFTAGPTAPALAYIGGLITTVKGWLSPATRTALAAGSLLVAVGLWLVIQILRTAPVDGPGVSPRSACIPREMYERHA